MKAAVITLSIVLVILAFTFNTERVERDNVQTKLENTQDLLVSCESMYVNLKDDKTFERNKDCVAQAAQLRKRWNNIQSGWYDEANRECYVSYKDAKTKEIEYARVSDMQDA
jgi:hypothetical protein